MDISKNTVNKSDHCMKCNKKILIIYKCKCENIFCTKHKYSDSHDCNYDYKLKQQEFLIKSNPVIIPRKIDKL